MFLRRASPLLEAVLWCISGVLHWGLEGQGEPVPEGPLFGLPKLVSCSPLRFPVRVLGDCSLKGGGREGRMPISRPSLIVKVLAVNEDLVALIVLTQTRWQNELSVAAYGFAVLTSLD